MDGEIWKDVEGYEGLYRVSNQGRVMSLHRNREKLLKTSPDNVGYPVVNLALNKHHQKHHVHVLVTMAFFGKRPQGAVVNHLDNNPLNNHVDNLEYTSPYGNTHHAIDIGAMQRMSRDTVLRIINLLNTTNHSCAGIAKITDTGKNAVISIMNGRSWREYAHLISPEARETRKPGNPKIPSRVVSEIRAMHKQGISQKDIATKFNIHHSHISRIVNHKARTYTEQDKR